MEQLQRLIIINAKLNTVVKKEEESAQNKKIILCAPADFGLFDAIKEGLEDLEYTVLGFPIEDGNYKYKGITPRIINAFRKVFFNDKGYKNRLKLKERRTFLNSQLSLISFADYALFIRPDIYPIDFIKKVQDKANKTSAYHWDSVDRFPTVINYIDLFDRFFLFDREDSLRFPNTKLTTNFYFPDSIPTPNVEKKRAYLLGSCDYGRLEQSILLKNKLELLHYDCDFTLRTNKSKEIEQLEKHGISIIQDVIRYGQNILNVKESTVLIDLHNQKQSGLSFRAFEGINYNKKLITTNKNIAKYDFYHPNNIFIWDGENENQLEQFLNEDIIEIPNNIKIKYGLQNWLNYLMDEQPFTKINVF